VSERNGPAKGREQADKRTHSRRWPLAHLLDLGEAPEGLADLAYSFSFAGYLFSSGRLAPCIEHRIASLCIAPIH